MLLASLPDGSGGGGGNPGLFTPPSATGILDAQENLWVFGAAEAQTEAVSIGSIFGALVRRSDFSCAFYAVPIGSLRSGQLEFSGPEGLTTLEFDFDDISR